MKFAKAHPEFVSEDGDYDGLIISYVPNTMQGFQRLYEEQHINAYSPKFMHVRKN